MNKSLAVINQDEFETMQRVSKALVSSGYFSDAKDVAKALVKVMAGREMGLGPFASMTGIHIIKGKPVLGANLIATLIKAHPDYNYRIKTHTDKVCEIEFFEHGESVGVSSFSVDNAKAAGLSTPNWSKYPRNMLFARAISNGAKWHTPGIFGGAPVYTPDEMGANLDYDSDGDEVIISPSNETSPQAQAKRERPSAAQEIMKRVGAAEDKHHGGGSAFVERIPTDAQRKMFHAVGVETYGKDNWDEKRAALVAALGKESSNDLTMTEMTYLIDGMKAKAS